MKKIKGEFMEAINILELKNSVLVNKYQDLKSQFEKRPPREEDMDLIVKLRDELLNKEKMYQDALDNMERYRNELINREENYNKIFNAKPKIGFIDPTQGRQSSKENSGKLNVIF